MQCFTLKMETTGSFVALVKNARRFGVITQRTPNCCTSTRLQILNECAYMLRITNMTTIEITETLSAKFTYSATTSGDNTQKWMTRLPASPDGRKHLNEYRLSRFILERSGC
jgi:hypothetical protein